MYWRLEELYQLRSLIESFKKKGFLLFQYFPKLDICTVKFHILDQLVEDIESFGSISVLSGGLFEITPTHFKYVYRTTSRGPEEALDTGVVLMSE